MDTLLILPSVHRARDAGFTDGTHPAVSMRGWRVWTPDHSIEALRGIRFMTVVVDSQVGRQDPRGWARDRALIHGHCTHADTVWIEP